ncbi:MAG: MBL fold metallo-hydrolase [Elusimicrobiota bacterium]|jgi:metallo-beta-lactamase family protein|nr:MBL fold metallo-hydrolase [Elusimicrobiota bacterium]
MKANRTKKFLCLFACLIFVRAYALSEISVEAYGAAQVVSGSCFLLKTDYENFIIDCGMFIGSESEQDKNYQVDTKLLSAKALFLTHAHLDHCAKIPLLIHKGFKGKIYSTDATKILALSLFKNRNGFDLIDREWFWSKRRKENGIANKKSVAIHWTQSCRDTIKSIEYASGLLKDIKKKKRVDFILCKKCCKQSSAEIEKFFETIEYDKETKISADFSVKAINAGHIPGSTSFIFTSSGKKILFSGDLSSGYSRLTGKFEIPQKADLIFMEATYGARGKISFEQYNIFRKDLLDAVDANKIVWIPALSFNRTQKVLYELKLLQDEGALSKEIPIYSVSPSANIITKIYDNQIKDKKDGWFLKEVYEKGAIIPENVKFRDIKKKALKAPLILISSNGDMSLGKSAQLATEILSLQNVFVMIVNYVAPESPAGLLLENKQPFKNFYSLAKIKKYDVFSDHADFASLEKWLSKQDENSKIFIIHSTVQSATFVTEKLKSKGFKKTSTAKTGIIMK